MNKLLIILLLNLFLSVSIVAQQAFVPKLHEFKGVIKTQNDEVIAGANLYFKKKDDVRTFTFVTDINGDFRAELPAGNYELTVNDVLSKSFKAYIKIQDEVVNANNVAFTVKTNKNLCGLSEYEVCPKPLSLPRPAYAAAARAANIKGEVIVKIIFRDGKMMAGFAVNGHPLLRKAAVTAAKKAKFELASDEKDFEIYMTYVFLIPPKSEKTDINKYKSLYRLEIISQLEIIDTSSH